jgi:hypothetical protein
MLTVYDMILHLKKKGYVADLVVDQQGRLLADHKELDLTKCSLDGTYRIEADSDPTQQSVVYSLSCKAPQIKGVLIDSFGTQSDENKQKIVKFLDS